MISHRVLAAEKIIELEPHGPLGGEDFKALGEIVRQERSHGRMPRGVVVKLGEFPGWRDLDALTAHIEFIRENHEFIRRIAMVSDDVELRIFVEKGIAPLLRCELRFFAAGELAAARAWVAAGS